jgi:hypothetical protein
MANNIIVPRRREDFFKSNGDPTARFMIWIEQVTGQTNTSSINIENSERAITSTGSRVSRNAARINSIELKEFEIVTTTNSLTTSEYQIIICKNSQEINVTLDPNALKDDEVHIKRRGAAVNVVGLIDGFTNKKINVKNYSMHLVFDGADWNEI